jgi:hypothetical protein
MDKEEFIEKFNDINDKSNTRVNRAIVILKSLLVNCENMQSVISLNYLELTPEYNALLEDVIDANNLMLNLFEDINEIQFLVADYAKDFEEIE